MTNIATDKNNMTNATALDRVRTLRKVADRYEKKAISPSEYISPETFAHYMRMAQDGRDEANEIEAAHLRKNS